MDFWQSSASGNFFSQKDNYIMKGAYLMHDIETLWPRIIKHAGEKFYQIRGGEFTYEIRGNSIIPDRTNIQISKNHIQEAIKYLPLSNTVPVQHLRGPSYIYAILMDKRILEGDEEIVFKRHNWEKLKPLQLGRYAEYFVMMEFTLFNFDVYKPEVDNKGIDFIIRKGHYKYYDVQVKSIRGLNYIFFPKDKFQLRENLLAAIVLFFEGKPPKLYLIPSVEWQEPNSLLTNKYYEGKKSKPELNISAKNLPLLEKYTFDDIIKAL